MAVHLLTPGHGPALADTREAGSIVIDAQISLVKRADVAAGSLVTLTVGTRSAGSYRVQ